MGWKHSNVLQMLNSSWIFCLRKAPIQFQKKKKNLARVRGIIETHRDVLFGIERLKWVCKEIDILTLRLNYIKWQIHVPLKMTSSMEGMEMQTPGNTV